MEEHDLAAPTFLIIHLPTPGQVQDGRVPVCTALQIRDGHVDVMDTIEFRHTLDFALRDRFNYTHSTGTVSRQLHPPPLHERGATIRIGTGEQ